MPLYVLEMIGALAGLEGHPQHTDLTSKITRSRRTMPTTIPTKFFCSIPKSLTTRRDQLQAGTDHEFTAQLAAVPMMAWYVFEQAWARVAVWRRTPHHRRPACPAPIVTDGGGAGGVMRPFCPDGYLWAQEAIERAARSWFAQQIAEVETAAGDERNQQAQR